MGSGQTRGRYCADLASFISTTCRPRYTPHRWHAWWGNV